VRRASALVALGLALAGCGGGESERVVVDLLAEGSPQPVGTVVLEDAGGGTRVDVGVPELESAGAPAIRAGTCVELRPREYKLSEFRDRRSITELDIPLDDLLERELKVTVSGRAANPHATAACAQLPFEGEDPDLVVADLLAPDGIETRGLAWVEEARPGRTRVGILLFDVVRGPEEAVIMGGSCRGEPTHELTEIRESESVTEIEARLDALADGEHYVVAAKACGPIQGS
jgi:hypothetical protein